MIFSFQFSLWWLLVPVAVVLLAVVLYADRTESDGYLSGLGTLAALLVCAVVFIACVAILALIHLYRATHP